ncbi:MAG TPA: hypothetical protein VK102_08075 [Sphingobacterium sp.]|nr:hypothetical protein [Sphingobacterium sp.]
MTIEEFKQDLGNPKPSPGLSVYLEALWWDAKGDWQQAHDLVDQNTDKGSAHIHAYLHRVEGDLWNARYWYNRAEESVFEGSLEEEWESLFHKFKNK